VLKSKSSNSLGNKPSFVVNHYAEPVSYSTHAFRSHNQHVLRDDLMEAVALGGRPLLGKLFKVIKEKKRKKKDCVIVALCVFVANTMKSRVIVD
jgi:myosin heavy subunit